MTYNQGKADREAGLHARSANGSYLDGYYYIEIEEDRTPLIDDYLDPEYNIDDRVNNSQPPAGHRPPPDYDYSQAWY
jgi:hypothetical protein